MTVIHHIKLLKCASAKFSVNSNMQKKTRVQHCSSCKNHGMNSAKKNHKCDYQDCTCILCELLQRSQKVMRHQQRVWRHQKLKLRPENSELEDPTNLLDHCGKTKCQVCDKCRNHNKLVPKRNHQCAYAQCSCVYCNLTSKRRDLMKYLQRVRRSGVISDANPEVRKARKFLEDNESQFEFADDESAATDEDDALEETRMDDDEMEETQGDGEQLIIANKRVSPTIYQKRRAFNPKKQRLLNFCEGQAPSPPLVEHEPSSLDLSDFPHSECVSLSGTKEVSPNYYEVELRLPSQNSPHQSKENVSEQLSNQTSPKLKLPFSIDGSPPPLIEMLSRPSSTEAFHPQNLTPSDSLLCTEKEIQMGHSSVLNKLTLESSLSSGYNAITELAQEKKTQRLNQSPLPPRMQIPFSSTDIPLYIEPNQSSLQTNLPGFNQNYMTSSNHLQHLRLQCAALLMYQRSPIKFAGQQEDLQLRNSEWESPSVPPSLGNYQNLSQHVVRPFALPLNVSQPYNPVQTFGNSSHWNERNSQFRPTFIPDANGISSIPRVLANSSQRCYLQNHF